VRGVFYPFHQEQNFGGIMQDLIARLRPLVDTTQNLMVHL
jgi:hypothetical protein